MKLPHVLALTALLIATVQAGQIPVPEGTFGGVPSGSSSGHPTLRQVASPPFGPAVQRVPNQLRNVVENSGICETTNGVYQASGYGDISEDGSIWFWFFAARNNPNTAPLALWFNGGVRASSMIGLFQEHGPCRINNDSDTVSLNSFSWNEMANILYIDQPVGVGYSSGNRIIGTSADAARDIWTFIQVWLSDSRFSKYQNRDLAIWTESYFLSQNAAIAAGRASGLALNLKMLGIGNGLTAPLPQYQGIINYATNNTYRTFNSTIVACENNGTDSACSATQDFCNKNVVDVLADGINIRAPPVAIINVDGLIFTIYQVYYTPNPSTDPYPRDITTYLASIRSKLNTDGPWAETKSSVYDNFAASGDWMRDSSVDLETVVNAGVRTLIYDGDADFIVNYQGVELMLDGLNSKFSDEYRQQSLNDWVVAGQVAGQFKNAGTLSYIRVFGAGHEVPAYNYGNLSIGQATLQMFSQIMANQSISNDGSVGSSGNGNKNSAQNTHLRFSIVASCFLLILLPTWIFL
ncbi:Carboxypeptidase S1 [Leucoagaricus sp. SymC.cos]|nr:Carboxypeptidase S1 [Leucoagaricus sp. SymC.cos]